MTRNKFYTVVGIKYHVIFYYLLAIDSSKHLPQIDNSSNYLLVLITYYLNYLLKICLKYNFLSIIKIDLKFGITDQFIWNANFSKSSAFAYSNIKK